MKRIAVVLSGCGFKDGTEITEAVASLIAITQLGATYQCFAPDKMISAVNHIDGKGDGERSCLAESARIARGNIRALIDLDPHDFDAVLFPGGYGAACNLSDWAKQGAAAQVLPDVVRVIQETHQQGKPIGAVCIAPVLVAKVLGDQEVVLTIGCDPDTAREIAKTGAIHENCAVDDYITDRAHKVVTTPAYMYDGASPAQVFQGISGLVKEMVEMA